VKSPLLADLSLQPGGFSYINSSLRKSVINKILCALGGSRERSEPRKAGQARGKYYFLKITFKKMEPECRLINGI